MNATKRVFLYTICWMFCPLINSFDLILLRNQPYLQDMVRIASLGNTKQYAMVVPNALTDRCEDPHSDFLRVWNYKSILYDRLNEIIENDQCEIDLSKARVYVDEIEGQKLSIFIKMNTFFCQKDKDRFVTNIPIFQMILGDQVRFILDDARDNTFYTCPVYYALMANQLNNNLERATTVLEHFFRSDAD